MTNIRYASELRTLNIFEKEKEIANLFGVYCNTHTVSIEGGIYGIGGETACFNATSTKKGEGGGWCDMPNHVGRSIRRDHRIIFQLPSGSIDQTKFVACFT